MVGQLARAAAILGFATAEAFVAAGAQPSPQLALDSARRALAEYARRAEALGVSGVVLVATGDQILLHRGMGWRDPAHRLPNDTSTLFYIASLSKQFVAAAVLRLEADGRLRTRDSIATYFPDAPADKRAITLDQLLSHTSGIGRYGWDPVRRDWAIENRDQATRGILHSPLAHAPGSDFDYQNANFIVLAAVVERVSGMRFGEYIEQQLLRPAGLHDTHFYLRPTSELRARVAWSLGDEAESFNLVDRDQSFLQFDRGVVTTASDLYRWLRALYQGVVLPETARRKLFTIRALLGTNYGYAAGWFVRTDSAGAPRVVFHRGDSRAYRSELRLYPATGRIFVALTNVEFAGQSITESMLNQALVVGRGGEDQLPAISRTTITASDRLAGEYVSQGGDRLIVEPKDGSLSVTPVGQRAIDWLTSGDTAGWRERQAADENSRALVEWLRGADSGVAGPVRALSPELRKALAEEWASLSARGGKLKSLQFLGATRDANGGGPVVIVRLKFQRDSLLYGVGWTNDTLAYTAPGARQLIAPRVFAPAVAGDWVSYDWTAEDVRHATFAGGPGDGGQATLTLETANGPVTFIRR